MLRGAMIGCGYISQQQLWAWSQVADAEIVAVCDVDEAKARGRADEFGIGAAYTDYRQMLAEHDLDFVDIATRPMTHLEMVRAGAERGLHVLCQKPVADTLDELRAMIAACDDAGVTFMVNENFRHQAWFRKLKGLLDTGVIGRPYNARFHNRWRSTLPVPEFEGQPFFQNMPRLIVFEAEIHVLDTARYLFGEAQTIYARLHRVSPHIAGEDKAVILADFNQLTCQIDAAWYAVPVRGPQGAAWASLVVEGDEGTLVLDRAGTLSLHRAKESEEWHFPPDTINQSFAATQRHFIDCVHTGLPAETSGPETLRTMALVFGAYRSNDERRVVSLDEFEVS
jgi:predicted dehydrogenase